MNPNDPWTAAFGGGQGRDPMQEQRIQYLYDMAQMNPKNSGLGEAYMQSYMDYMYPQQNDLASILGLGGGQQQGYGQSGGIDVNAYTAMMEGRMSPQDYQSQLYGGYGQTDPYAGLTIETPEQGPGFAENLFAGGGYNPLGAMSRGLASSIAGIQGGDMKGAEMASRGNKISEALWGLGEKQRNFLGV